jgi:FtsP/CotA-like multicopper oxidase with cupredoxin domain
VFAQQARPDSGKPAPSGYVLQRGTPPRADSVETLSSPLVLTRGETTAITVINRLREATTVHWHGMELESVYDGVSGWSRSGTSIAPLLAPGDSFTAVMTPPRAGTYIYHTHIDEGTQLRTGMYGPLLVMEPGERFDPATDLVMMIGEGADSGKFRPMLNGRRAPPPLTLRAGTTYRLRFVSILPADPIRVELVAADSTPVTWRSRAKDGADLPPAARVARPARIGRFGVGETYDFEWTPSRAMDAELVIRVAPRWTQVRQRIVVR